MKILQLAALDETVPPKKYGGTELVVANLCEGLVKAGNDVYLGASGDSQTSAHLIPLVPKALRNAFSESEITLERDFLRTYNIYKILKLAEELQPDIIHNHLSWRLIHFADFLPCPMISTMHGPMTDKRIVRTGELFPQSPMVGISDNQRSYAPTINWAGMVYNGIDVTKFKVGTGERNYFAFLGRIAPLKGTAEICRMIKSTGNMLKIGAKVDKEDVEYFEKEVKPLIDGQQIQYMGELDHKGKVELLAGAKALLSWLNWEEPFGLVVPESNACGTPVIVNPRGSMPELIRDGYNGFLIGSIDEMRVKMDEVDTISSENCRKIVKEKFSVEKMVDGYTKIYEKVIGNSTVV